MFQRQRAAPRPVRHPSFLPERFNALTLSLLSVVLTCHSLPLHQNSMLREHCECSVPTGRQGMTNTQIAHVSSCACSIAAHLRLHLQNAGSKIRLLRLSRHQQQSIKSSPGLISVQDATGLLEPTKLAFSVLNFAASHPSIVSPSQASSPS